MVYFISCWKFEYKMVIYVMASWTSCVTRAEEHAQIYVETGLIDPSF